MTKLKISVTILVTAISTLISNASDPGNLGKLFDQTGWHKIIGTWIDPETKGKNNRTTFAWKYEGTVIESITRMPNKETTSMFGRNPKSGEVFVLSADSLGGSSGGSVVFSNDLAVFNITYAAHTGDSGEVEIKYQLVDENTMTVTFVMGNPVTIKLIREQ